MKVRNGFVSNSSSSSFMCVVSKSDHEKVISTLPTNLAEIIEKYVEEGKIGDMEVVGYGDMDNQGFVQYSGSIGWGEEMIVDDEGFDNATSAYNKALNEMNISRFSINFG